MKKVVIAPILLAACSLACLPYSMKRTPELRLPKHRSQPELAPAIRLVLDTSHAGSAPRKVERALKRAKKVLPYLSNSSSGIENPDYTIELGLRYSDGTSLEDYSMATGGLVPTMAWEQVSATATVKDAQGEPLGTFESTQTNKWAASIVFIYLVPVLGSAAVCADHKLWNLPVRDALFQAGEAIEQNRIARSGPGREAWGERVTQAPGGDADSGEKCEERRSDVPGRGVECQGQDVECAIE